MKREQLAESWTARKTDDEARHLASCIVCREKLRPASDQKLYAVKNARTRQLVHVLINGESLENKLGWPRGEILYSMLIKNGASKGPPMSEEVKAKLREAREKRKAENKLKRLVRANTPARPVEGEQEDRKENAMATKKKNRQPRIEAELTKVLGQIRAYRDRGQVEELTYLVGAGMAALEQMGCPIHGIRLDSEAVVDAWANSDKAPART